jgi:flagellar hook-associated protein 3 FlgL
MSGSLNNIYNTLSYTLNRNMTAMAKLQEQASTGSRVNRASDDPTGAYQILGLNSSKSSLDDYLKNVSSASDVLGLSGNIIQNIGTLLSNVKTTVSQISSGTYTDSARKQTAEQVNETLEQIVQLANTKQTNQYLFGGDNSGNAPYTVERTNGEITKVIYQGSSSQRSVEVSPGVQMGVLSVGSKIFCSDDRSDPVFSGVTGAKSGTGTSNVQGDVWLTVINDGSNYKISIDDGLTYTTVPAGGQTNQAVTDSRTGKVLYVDTTGITNTGVELVQVPGTYNVFDTLLSIRDILQNNKGLSADQLQQFRSGVFSSLDEVTNLLSQTTVSTGTKISLLDNLTNNLTDIKNQAEDQISTVGDADVAQISIDLTRREVLYQMSLSAAAKMMSLSLLDYIAVK